MLDPKENLLDRIEQSFYLLKKDFIKLVFPIFLFNFFTLVVLWNILSSIFFKIADFDFISELDPSNMSKSLSTIYYNMSLYLAIGMFVFMFYLTFLLPFQISLIKSIKQSFLGENIDVKENLIYGFKKLQFLFKTYYYKFIYVAGIPSFIFIFGGIFLIVGIYSGIGDMLYFGYLFMFLGLFIFLIFSLYRGYKSIFSIYSAIDHDDYTREDFKSSIKITEDKWFEIFGNFILVGIIIWLVSSIIGGIISVFSSPMDFSILGTLKDFKPEDTILFLESLTKTSFGDLVSKSLGYFITTITSVFTFTFTYIYFKRLELEKSIDKESKMIHSDIIEL